MPMYFGIEPPTDPPDVCEEHGYNKLTCEDCEGEREYYQDLAADIAYKSWRLGE